MDLIVRAPSDDDLLLAHATAHEVAAPGDLTLMAHQQPHAGEDLLQLLLVNVRVTENRVVNGALGRVDELLYR